MRVVNSGVIAADADGSFCNDILINLGTIIGTAMQAAVRKRLEGRAEGVRGAA